MSFQTGFFFIQYIVGIWRLSDLEILLGVGLLVISGVGTFFYMQNQDDFDIVSDYKEIKAAFKTFRNENIGLSKGINNEKQL